MRFATPLLAAGFGLAALATPSQHRPEPEVHLALERRQQRGRSRARNAQTHSRYSQEMS